MAIYGSASASVRSLEVRGSRGNAITIYSSGTTEIRNWWIHSNQQSAVLVQADSATVIGGNNDLRDNGAELGLFAPPTLRTPLAVQTESMDARVPTDYPTIQEAIDAVFPGGIVEVAEGSFSEGLTIWTPLTLRGQGPDATVLGAPAGTDLWGRRYCGRQPNPGGMMLKINEYYDGKVKSIGFEDALGPTTVGVMEAGEYTFSTGAKETMLVVSGALTVRLPNSDEWSTFEAGSSFDVPGDASFDLKVAEPTAYLCRYG
jgi:uncharacterized protein YaiE (UPF0345 family)